MTTLVTDEFDEGKARGASIHHIVYGRKGQWTDDLDAKTIETLMLAGIIVLAKIVPHNAGQTRIWVSVEGEHRA